jgi:PIN domain nuclease of toxin-antitoxin system
VRYGWSDQLIESRLAAFSFDAEDFHSAVALRAGFLYRLTSPFGLSLGDRACLALAMALKLPVVTSDRVWSQLDLGVEVVVCR